MPRSEQESTLPQPWRETPLIHSSILSKHAGCQIYLKLENLQPSGSFKSRGIGNFLRVHLSRAAAHQGRDKTHFYISSGGNAGLACVHAAVTLGVLATIVVPMTTNEYMIAKLRAAGASEVIQIGESWAEADGYLKETIIPKAKADGENPIHVPPFDAEEVWDGNATLVEETLQQLGQSPDAMVCSVGGGGLFCGVMKGLDNAKLSHIPVLAIETQGAHSLALALEKGQLATLPAITSIATSLGARTVAAQALAYAQRDCVKSIVLKDIDAMEGCVRFADDERIMVETSCGVCLALCYNGRLKSVFPEINEKTKIVIVVCGGSNVTAEMLHKWESTLSG